MRGEPKTEVDVENKLQITINNVKPVGLVDLMQSLLAVASQFESFVNSRSPDAPDACSELLIQEVRKGSIVVDLITHSLPLVPLIWEGGAIHEWVSYAKSIVEWLSGKGAKPDQTINKTTLNDFSTIFQPTALDNGSNFTCIAVNGGNITNEFYVSSSDAARIQTQARAEVERLEVPSDNLHRKQCMTWFQTRFGDPDSSGSKAIIESISKRAIKVIFENDAVKDAMSHGDSRFEREWQHLAYLVDVEVQTIGGRPRLYKILGYYPEDTFDPDED